ncbi:hypothetical protein B5807_05004 [Epicoccum nigrum]|uniref:Uncharacterized protein n=1 Tax=Epicoccum nigrum TaxID=105696 RepID=A0A1Y2M3F4_EPING|nr:hypothetical protein B5807_05004 [Epicoccum nigrum]
MPLGPSLNNHDRNYEATRLAGIQTLRRLRVIDEHSPGPLVIPSAIATIQNTKAEAEDYKGLIAAELGVKFDGNGAEEEVEDV